MPNPNMKAEIRSVNLALKADCYRVAIQIRGKRLSLVATLPPKPNSTNRKPHQQRIALKLGATMVGLRRAKAKAILLADQLDRDKFTWDDWIDIPSDEPEIQTCAYWIERFKTHIWEDLPEPKETTWTRRFLYFGFNKLPLDTPLTPEALVTAVLTKLETNKAARDRACMQLQRLANFAEIDIDLKPYKARYSQADVVPKTIPDDSDIQTTIDSIPDPKWRYVFALMAVYGLRNHEAFHCTLENKDDVLVANIPNDTKIGSRVSYPNPVEWVERWLSCDRVLPQIKTLTNDDYGQRCAHKWRKYKAPGTPYSLRHAYAIRCHAASIRVAIAANWMGHSPEMHMNVYQRWISEKISRQEWEKLKPVGVDIKNNPDVR